MAADNNQVTGQLCSQFVSGIRGLSKLDVSLWYGNSMAFQYGSEFGIDLLSDLSFRGWQVAASQLSVPRDRVFTGVYDLQLAGLAAGLWDSHFQNSGAVGIQVNGTEYILITGHWFLPEAKNIAYVVLV